MPNPHNAQSVSLRGMVMEKPMGTLAKPAKCLDIVLGPLYIEQNKHTGEKDPGSLTDNDKVPENQMVEPVERQEQHDNTRSIANQWRMMSYLWSMHIN